MKTRQDVPQELVRPKIDKLEARGQEPGDSSQERGGGRGGESISNTCQAEDMVQYLPSRRHGPIPAKPQAWFNIQYSSEQSDSFLTQGARGADLSGRGGKGAQMLEGGGRGGE